MNEGMLIHKCSAQLQRHGGTGFCLKFLKTGISLMEWEMEREAEAHWVRDRKMALSRGLTGTCNKTWGFGAPSKIFWGLA